ncbi:TAXI family TRAP transporter solute-binding subunit [Streptomyces sp. AK02-01A]|uniref:TAXI family TRAP transporter solute-binding subunit n=1 Tax=Streptomyces sp. AK02-01A TaxID=3028648 RepID=UPI0029B7E9EB|nr:TAXI family TRAP transporter solute-binding subunit [Streptomyces sp. AK02-01A]MDX3852006.1 TAXI family TRAP transporter solute-binding subunit [Streptomyces sp. AK02-01A]
MFPALSRIGRGRVQAAAALLVVAGLLLWWLLPIGASTPSGSITFSTGAAKGVYQTYGAMLKDDLNRDLPDVSIELQNSEGSQQNIARVATGEADFTIATADAVGKYQKDGKPGADRLRGCARLYDDYVQLVVARDSAIRSVGDLAGRKVGVGQEGSGVRLIADRIMTAAGLDPRNDITPVPAGIDTMPGLLEQGGLEAFFWSGGLPTGTLERLSERFHIRLVPLEAELISKLHASNETASRYYRSAEIPADAYGEAQNGAAVPTVAVANLLVTTDRMDPRLTEGFTRTVIDSRDRIGNVVHPAQLVDLRTAIYTDPLPLHEGAKRYYRSVKP